MRREGPGKTQGRLTTASGYGVCIGRGRAGNCSVFGQHLGAAPPRPRRASRSSAGTAGTERGCGAVRGRLRQLPALSTARGPPPAGTRNCTGSRTGRTAALSVVGLPIPSFIAAQGVWKERAPLLLAPSTGPSVL